MDVYFESTVGVCAEFTKNHKKQEISIVISPLKVTQADTVLKLNSGCNMWKSCENFGCQFSLLSHPGTNKGGG